MLVILIRANNFYTKNTWNQVLFFYRDRFRTAVNIMGDSFGAAIVYYRSLKELGLLTTDKNDTSVELAEKNSTSIAVEEVK